MLSQVIQEWSKLCQSSTNLIAIKQSDRTWQNTKYTEDVLFPETVAVESNNNFALLNKIIIISGHFLICHWNSANLGYAIDSDQWHVNPGIIFQTQAMTYLGLITLPSDMWWYIRENTVFATGFSYWDAAHPTCQWYREC